MLQIFDKINKIYQTLEENDDVMVENGQKAFRILVKVESMIEVFAKTRYHNTIESTSFGENVFLYTITPEELDEDHYYNAIFANPDKIQTGLTWRFDSLLSTEKPTEKIKNPCNVLTFYSYKGGMGRTTTLCSYAIHLAQSGKKVVIIDCDFEAPGFFNFFNINDKQAQKSGLVEYLLDKDFLGKENVKLVDDYLIPINIANNNAKADIFVLPAGNLSYANIPNSENGVFSKENETLNKNLYHYIHGLARLNMANTHNMLMQFRELFEDLVRELDLTEEDYILIDSRTGFNEIFGITALHLSDLVVGFFGSSEQTRAGLYFLLDKYQALQALPECPKLVLINAIIPNNITTSKIFEDSFKRLLANYKDEKESDWDILGSVPTFQLHENKVLKELGVQFYEQDELNLQKEKELHALIQHKKFINDDGKEQAFEDLSLIFNQLDVFTTQYIAPVFDVNTLNIAQLREIVLKHLNTLLAQYPETGTVAIFAEDKPIDVPTFFYRDCMKELFKKEKFIIQGFKGSGKTYLYKALKDTTITGIILKKADINNVEEYKFIDIIETKGGTNNDKKCPFEKSEIQEINNFHDFWKVYMWSSIMLDTSFEVEIQAFRLAFPQAELAQDIVLLKKSVNKEKKIIFKKYLDRDENMVLIERDLKNLNDFLETKKIKLFVLFDQLDKIANLVDWSKFITPLVEFWRDNYNKEHYNNIFPKIFIRTDIINRITTNNSLSLIKTAVVPIEWKPIEMYAYFFKLVFSEEKSKQAFFKLMKEYKQYDTSYIGDIEEIVANNKQLPLDIDKVKSLLNTFFGSDIKSPKGLSLGDPFTFFFANFSNADETISLRPFINLISGAVSNGLQNILPNYKNASDGNSDEITPIFPQFENNPPLMPILHYCYTTDSTVRDKATKEHFEDLTNESGNEGLQNTIAYLKSLPKGSLYKKVVLTNVEMDNLLEEVINFPEYKNQMSSKISVIDLKNLLVINGITYKNEQNKNYRFAQMYKYWLGLTSRSEDSLRIGQKLKDRITKLNSGGFGFVATGYKSPQLFFHASNLTGARFDELKIDDLVEFIVAKNEKGLIATQIRKIAEL